MPENFVFGFEVLAPPQGARQLHLRSQNREQPRVVPRLLDEIARAGAHGVHRKVNVRPGGHHHHRESGVERLNTGQQRESFLTGGRVAGVVQVNQHGVELSVIEGRQRLGRGIYRFRPVSF